MNRHRGQDSQDDAGTAGRAAEDRIVAEVRADADRPVKMDTIAAALLIIFLGIGTEECSLTSS